MCSHIVLSLESLSGCVYVDWSKTTSVFSSSYLFPLRKVVYDDLSTYVLDGPFGTWSWRQSTVYVFDWVFPILWIYIIHFDILKILIHIFLRRHFMSIRFLGISTVVFVTGNTLSGIWSEVVLIFENGTQLWVYFFHFSVRRLTLFYRRLVHKMFRDYRTDVFLKRFESFFVGESFTLFLNL